MSAKTKTETNAPEKELPKNSDLERKVEYFNDLIKTKSFLIKSIQETLTYNGEIKPDSSNRALTDYEIGKFNLEKIELQNQIYYHKKALAHWENELHIFNTHYAPLWVKSNDPAEWEAIFSELCSLIKSTIGINKRNLEDVYQKIKAAKESEPADIVQLYQYALNVIQQFKK